jgi:hypothetical protein
MFKALQQFQKEDFMYSTLNMQNAVTGTLKSNFLNSNASFESKTT